MLVAGACGSIEPFILAKHDSDAGTEEEGHEEANQGYLSSRS